MKFELIQNNADGDTANRVDEHDINPVLLKEAVLAFAICCALDSDDPDSAKTAEWFYPELGEYDAPILEEALRNVAAGQNQAGELDMSDFSVANPMLMGAVSTRAHALYKLIVGSVFAQQKDVCWSAGDAHDIAALIDFFMPMLAEYGFSPDRRGVSAAIGRLRDVFSRAASESTAVLAR